MTTPPSSSTSASTLSVPNGWTDTVDEESSPVLDMGSNECEWAVIKFRMENQPDVAIAWYRGAENTFSAPIIMGGRLIVEGYDVQQFCGSPTLTADDLVELC